ncbi:putative pentatricopeptide repeat-containing protein [Panicum miliaceum]|uniref:Pentatricopeptide repeat-containing protein n=1 Tax=Panicum miliaceum TaxID=4540 RepID=A0A3L6QXB4_PANMI|nr:putative pentatricopeptide repeat-containing protein [Panicum miliaceum]
MARSAAAQLLACSARPFLPGHHHHHARRPLLLLNSRSKTSSSSNFPRPSPPRDPGSSLFHEISDLVASARNGSALRPEMNDEACHHDRGAAAVQRAEGARGIAPESATAASSSVFCSISNMGHLGGLPDDGSQPSDTAGEATGVLVLPLGETTPGVPPHNTMLYITGEARTFAIMEELVGEMDRQMCPKDIKTWTIILSSYGKAGHIGKMLSTFEAMRKSGSIGIDSKVYMTVLHALCNAKKPELALEFYKDMPRNMEVGTGILRLLMCCLATSDNATEAVCSIRDDMIKGMKHPEEYCYMEALRSFCIAGKVEEAWKVFQQMKRKSMASPFAFQNLLRGLCKAGKMAEALQIIEYMKGTLGINSAEFAFLIDGYLRKGEHTKALDLLQLMQHLFAIDQYEEACGLFEEMLKNGVEPDIVTLTALIGGHVCSGHISEAWDAFRNINKSGQKPTLKAYTVFIQELCKASRPLEATELLKEMLESDFRPSEGTFCQILSSSDDWGPMQQALEMRSVHFSPNLVDAILKRCKRNSRAALQFFSWVGKRSYYMPTTKTYTTAMKLAGSAKDFKHMRYLYREMLRTGCSPTVDTWNVMVCQYGNAGLSEKALGTFREMKQHGFLPDKTTYQHLIMYLTCSEGRKVDEAAIIFKEMCHAGHIPDNDTVFKYISALCECRKIAEARSSVVSLCERGFSVKFGYSIFLRSLCRADRVEEALSLFNCIEKHGCSRDQYMYASLIHALLRRDQFEDAVAKLTEMKEAGIPQNTYMYTSFIVYYFQKGDVVKALDVLKEMEENGCEPTVVTHSALIRGYMSMDMVSEAWDVFQQMKLKGPAPDFETYSMFISCLCKAGRSEGGLQLIHDMLECCFIPSTVNFMTVVHGLNMEGKHGLAESVLRLFVIWLEVSRATRQNGTKRQNHHAPPLMPQGHPSFPTSPIPFTSIIEVSHEWKLNTNASEVRQCYSIFRF